MRWSVAGSLLLSGACVAVTALAAPAPGAAQPAVWEHHHAQINYFGVTTLYTCDGLEGQVRRILEYLGARKDLKVSAVGCPGGPEVPSHNAWIKLDFDVLIPADGGAVTAAPSVAAAWSAVDLSPRHPGFMDAGDCELMQDMKDMVVANFHLHDLAYSTSCFPNSLSLDGFSVKGATLRPVATKPG